MQAQRAAKADSFPRGLWKKPCSRCSLGVHFRMVRLWVWRHANSRSTFGQKAPPALPQIVQYTNEKFRGWVSSEGAADFLQPCVSGGQRLVASSRLASSRIKPMGFGRRLKPSAVIARRVTRPPAVTAHRSSTKAAIRGATASAARSLWPP